MYKKVFAIIDSIERSGFIDPKIINELRAELELLLSSNNESIQNIKTGLTDFLETVLNRIPDPIFIKDKNHIWIFLNDSACELFGFRREELIGKSDYDIFLEEEADVYWEIDNQVFTSGKEIRNEEFQTHPKTKERRILDTKKTLYVDENGNKILIGIIRDITEQRMAIKKMQEAVASKEKIFSIIAHDLKEPFNTLIGFSNLLKKNYDSYDDEKRKYLIGNLNNVANNTFAFIQNILDWAASQTGKITYNPEIFCVEPIIAETISLFSEFAEKKNIHMKTKEKGVKNKVFADQNMVKTIFRNLIMNAVKFTSDGGEITIQIEYKKSELTACVVDTGIGLSSKQIVDLFNSSETKPSKGTSGETGIGLGLMLCREFVELNNGKIWYEPNKPVGSKFYFTLPSEN